MRYKAETKEMETKILLTLAIPTFNRLACLQLLITSIMRQSLTCGILGEKLEILICDNASTDGTADYLRSLYNIKGVRIIHRDRNFGGADNTILCYESIKSKYLWIMGDDDIPLNGSILEIIGRLERDAPDLVYLPARWITGDLTPYAERELKRKSLIPSDNMELATYASIYVTFISSWIANIDAYKDYTSSGLFNRYRNTSLPQLEVIFTLILFGKRFLHSTEDWIIARGGNTSGYVILDTFSREYNHIVDNKFSKNTPLWRFFRHCMIMCFIPRIIWHERNRSLGSYENSNQENILHHLKTVYGNDIFLRVIIAPIILSNKPIAWLFTFIAYTIGKVWLYLWRIRTFVKID